MVRLVRQRPGADRWAGPSGSNKGLFPYFGHSGQPGQRKCPLLGQFVVSCLREGRSTVKCRLKTLNKGRGGRHFEKSMGIFGDIDMGPWNTLEVASNSPKNPAWSGEFSRGRGQISGSYLRVLFKAFYRILGILANLDLGDLHFWATFCLVSQRKEIIRPMPPENASRPGREGGDILRNPWEFLEASIWGPKTHLRSLVMPQNDHTWSGECGRGRGQMGGPGLWALIKAFLRILVILANLDLGDVHF